MYGENNRIIRNLKKIISYSLIGSTLVLPACSELKPHKPKPQTTIDSITEQIPACPRDSACNPENRFVESELDDISSENIDLENSQVNETQPIKPIRDIEQVIRESRGTNKYAILIVGHDSRPEAAKVFRNDINIMTEVLEKNDYSIFILDSDNESEEDIYKTIQEVSKNSNENTQLFFYYTGHGNLENGCTTLSYNPSLQENYLVGHAVSDDENQNQLQIIVPDGKIKSEELFYYLKKFKGKIATVIDACHAGGIIDCRPKNYRGVIITSSSKDKTSKFSYSLGLSYFTKVFAECLDDLGSAQICSPDNNYNLEESSDSNDINLGNLELDECLKLSEFSQGFIFLLGKVNFFDHQFEVTESYNL
ncbi:hypothetical protein HOK51_06585 [Candidatus Woesearchaeota archaeon]|jgi:hypothetical protein|nr:hypothetical protein [Candidatus Woesearchaeota archaeon]MBT6519491.1 hypothetical protein [Candidatus Woesearchaeota archaeon]MBT7368239.1 hypothetical protein [Candidatus Woesearchaeota archaeon]